MASITVTTDPANAVTGIAATTYWVARFQNIDPTETVYRLASATKPDPVTPAFHHPPGDRWTMHINPDDPAWLWVAQGEAVVMVEVAPSW